MKIQIDLELCVGKYLRSEVNGIERVVISTPARLHFGLIDMNGEIVRIDGGGETILIKANNIVMCIISEE